MPITRRLALILPLTLTLAIALAPAAKWLIDSALAQRDTAPARLIAKAVHARYSEGIPNYDFGRVMRRLLLIFALAAIFISHRALQLGELTRTALIPPAPRIRGAKHFILGLGVSVASFATLTLFLFLLGSHKAKPHPTALEFARTLLDVGVAAVITGVSEEWLFRGVLFGGLRRELGLGAAVALSSGLFAIVHVFSPSRQTQPGFDPWIGLGVIGNGLATVGARPEMALWLAGLALLGATLCLAFARAGALYLAIGLHMGWVVGMRLDGLFFAANPPPNLTWLFGDGRLINGCVGLGLLMVMLLAFLPRGRRGRQTAESLP